jgi:xanthine dehydrogenase YagS FAD-binding subunit
MRPFVYSPASTIQQALGLGASKAHAHDRAPVQYLAGGTAFINLMKIGVMSPSTLVDIKRIAEPSPRRISRSEEGLRIGALVSMAQAAKDLTVKTEYPVLSQSLWMAASPQLRAMATLGGNVLQRTRCHYFRYLLRLQ